VEAYGSEIDRVLITAEEIETRLAELGEAITRDHAGQTLLLIGVLKGAFVVMADLSRHINLPLEFDFMAVSSYGAARRGSKRSTSTSDTSGSTSRRSSSSATGSTTVSGSATFRSWRRSSPPRTREPSAWA
jgi:hypoxanthine-guanine phosphoribosyltransferase